MEVWLAEAGAAFERGDGGQKDALWRNRTAVIGFPARSQSLNMRPL